MPGDVLCRDGKEEYLARLEAGDQLSHEIWCDMGLSAAIIDFWCVTDHAFGPAMAKATFDGINRYVAHKQAEKEKPA